MKQRYNFSPVSLFLLPFIQTKPGILKSIHRKPRLKTSICLILEKHCCDTPIIIQSDHLIPFNSLSLLISCFVIINALSFVFVLKNPRYLQSLVWIRGVAQICEFLLQKNEETFIHSVARRDRGGLALLFWGGVMAL